jgi:hypothetical protein
MPIRRFRSVEEMNRPNWREPGSPELYRAIERVWSFGQRTSRIRFSPGVHRFRSIEEMNDSEDRYNERMSMKRAEVREWLGRWKAVEERSLGELRRLSPEDKLAHLASLMRSSSLFDYRERDQEQDLDVMKRWMLLRKRLRDAGE